MLVAHWQPPAGADVTSKHFVGIVKSCNTQSAVGQGAEEEEQIVVVGCKVAIGGFAPGVGLGLGACEPSTVAKKTKAKANSTNARAMTLKLQG